MLQHSLAELAVCREAWELKVDFPPPFSRFSPHFLPTAYGEEGRKEGGEG